MKILEVNGDKYMYLSYYVHLFGINRSDCLEINVVKMKHTKFTRLEGVRTTA
jgi:hypothetical protein